MEAAVAYYKATGKRKFLDIMCRFADLICVEFGDYKNNKAYPGHQEIEIGLIKLYEVTGNENYIDQASKFLNRRGVGENYFLIEQRSAKFKRIFPELSKYQPEYSQSHLPVREQMTAEGHAVRAVYMYSAMADVSAKNDDEELFEACKNLWNNIVEKRMYITGGIGSSGILERFTTDYDLPNNCNYSETCASIGLALFGRRMAQITKDASYMDIVEQALYNTVLSGIAMDGKSFFYVNPLEVWPDNCMEGTSKFHVKPVRQKWFGVACCPPNVARTLASLGEYVYFNSDDTVWVNMFVSGSIKSQIAGGEVTLEVKAYYPVEEQVKIIVKSTTDSGKIAVRIPGFAKDTVVKVNGNVCVNKVDKGYMIIELMSGITEIELLIPLKPRFIYANQKVREDVGKVAIMKGPIVYCMEQQDNEENLSAYFIDTKQGLKEEYVGDLLQGTNIIKGSGKKIIANKEHNCLYGENEPKFESKELTFIPYAYWCNRKHGEMLVWVKVLM